MDAGRGKPNWLSPLFHLFLLVFVSKDKKVAYFLRSSMIRYEKTAHDKKTVVSYPIKSYTGIRNKDNSSGQGDSCGTLAVPQARIPYRR